MDQLATRAATRTAAFIAALGAVVFLSAGSIRYWQGWLFWLSVSASVILTTAHLLRHDPALVERRMRVGPRAETLPRQKVVQAVNLAMFVAILVVAGLDHRFGWSRVPAAIVVAANLLVMAAFAFIVVVFRANTFAASTITVEAGQHVVSTGPYRYVRHPMYAGAIVCILAMPVALGSLWGLLPAAIFPPLLVVRIFDEERTLSAELPGYDDYRSAVPYRLIPLVW